MLQEKERRSKVSFAPAWCKRGDSNSHGGCHTHLKRACLPIPTLLQLTYSLIIIANPVDFVNSFFGKSQGLLNLLFCRAWGGDGFPWRPHPTPRGADGSYGTPCRGAVAPALSGSFSYDIGAAQTLVGGSPIPFRRGRSVIQGILIWLSPSWPGATAPPSAGLRKRAGRGNWCPWKGSLRWGRPLRWLPPPGP